jgi:glycosyltransferase involved in cell wall biosynthesis
MFRNDTGHCEQDAAGGERRMKMLLVHATIDHHSLPLAKSLYERLPPGTFAYAGLRELSAERTNLGWGSGELSEWMIPRWRSDADAVRFEAWWHTADVVMCAPKLFDLMRERVARRMYVFHETERWFKPPWGRWRFIHPLWARHSLKFRRMARTPYMHYLPVGVYAAKDMRWFVSMPQRMWAWAWYVEPSSFGDRPQLERDCRILWAGRMIRLKHVEDLIRAFADLTKKRLGARLTLVGDGPERERLVRLAHARLADGTYQFLPPTSPAGIRALMRRSDVYVLMSNGYEGWGAVIPEAMAEGCAVAASTETGAGASLIDDKINGRLFRCGDWKRLADILGQMVSDPGCRRRLARAGKGTVDELWSPATAAERFLNVADAILSGRPTPSYNHGPMRPAWHEDAVASRNREGAGAEQSPQFGHLTSGYAANTRSLEPRSHATPP